MPLTLTTRRTIEIAASCAALLLAALIFHAWLAAHDDQLRLASTLATQKQALDAADARERDRNATLKDALAQIDALKRSAQNETPAQLARALQIALQLPQPITVGTAAPPSKDAHPPDVRTAGVSPAPLPPSATQQQDPKNPPQETERHKSLLDLLLHRTPNAKASANSTSVEPGQTPPSSSKAAKRKRRITANPAGNCHLTSRPQLKRREFTVLAKSHKRRKPRSRRATINRRNSRRRPRPPLQLRPRLPRLPAPTHRRQTKRHRRRRQNPRPHPRTRRRRHRHKRRPLLAPPETQRPLASHRRRSRRRHLRRRPLPHRPLPLNRRARVATQNAQSSDRSAFLPGRRPPNLREANAQPSSCPSTRMFCGNAPRRHTLNRSFRAAPTPSHQHNPCLDFSASARPRSCRQERSFARLHADLRNCKHQTTIICDFDVGQTAIRTRAKMSQPSIPSPANVSTQNFFPPLSSSASHSPASRTCQQTRCYHANTPIPHPPRRQCVYFYLQLYS